MRIGIDNVSPGQATSRSGPGGMRLYLQSLLSQFSVQLAHHQYPSFTPRWTDPVWGTPPRELGRRFQALCGQADARVQLAARGRNRALHNYSDRTVAANTAEVFGWLGKRGSQSEQ